MHPAERKEGISLKYLVIKAQQGDARAFVRLIDIHKQSMYKIARSYFTSDEDIADAIQDTIETCWKSIGHLAEAEYFRTWMTRILINKCIDIIRKNKREHPVSDFPEYGEVSRELDNSEFNELMNSLDEKYRTILLLYYGEGFKISEIAQLLDMEEMERILKSNVEIPDPVEQKINDTYRNLGLTDENRSRRVHKRKKKAWVTIAAAAALIAGFGVTVYAAGHFFSAQLTQKDDKLTYSLNVDPSEKEAHEIRVTLGYIPDGYICQGVNASTEEWYNEETGGVMDIISYNAAELYEMSQTQDDPLHAPFTEDNFIKSVDIQGMSVDLFTSKDYIDSDETIQDIFVFNEEWGYAVHVWLNGPGLPDDEVIKVAEGLNIEVLDTTVPYPTEEEIAAINEKNQWIEDEIEKAASGITDESICGLNDVMRIDGDIYENYQGIEYQAVDIQVTDTLPPDEFLKENFIRDTYPNLTEYVNEDGSLKPHERFTDAGSQETESAEASFIIVTTKIRNTRGTAQKILLSPSLRHLDKNDNGTYRLTQPRDKSSPAQESWKRLTTDGLPFYQSAPNNGGTDELLTTIQPGEEIECTSVYVADNDCLDSAYMQFFGFGEAAAGSPALYVKVTE